MSEFFKPMRQKNGVVALVMACALMSAWMRSIIPKSDPFVADLVDFHSLFGSQREDGALAGVGTQRNSLALLIERDTPLAIAEPHSLIRPVIQVGAKFDTERSMSGKSAQILTGPQSITILMPTPVVSFPLWWIVIPLSLISAWLLLSKPCQLTLQKSTEPIVTDET